MSGARRRGAVLFDAAGTLIELREPVGESYARVARDFGVECSAERLDAAFRATFDAAPPMAFPGVERAAVPALEFEWWRERVRETFRHCDPDLRFPRFDEYFAMLFEIMGAASAWRAVAGSHELLRELRARGFGCAIVSNFDFRLHAILAGLGLAPLLDTVVLTADVAAAKPDPAGFALAIARLGVSPGSVFVVGDHPDQDLGAARAAGLRAVDVGSLATLGALLSIVAPEPDDRERLNPQRPHG